MALNINDIIYHFRLSEYTVTINGVEQTGTPAEIVSKLQTEVFTAPGGAVEVTYYQRKTVLTDAQIKALPTTPIAVVPDPGAGKVIVLHSYILTAAGLAVNYGNLAQASPLYIVYSYSADPASWSELSGKKVKLYNLQDNKFSLQGAEYTDPDGVLGGTTALEWINGAGLYIILDNVGGDLTGGDPSNTLEVTVFYSIVDL